MRLLFTILLVVVTTLFVQAQIPATWDISIKKGANDNEYIITALADIEDDWYVYSQYVGSEQGPIPTELIVEGVGIKKIGKATEAGPHTRTYDDMFGRKILKYKRNMLITQTITAPKGSTIKGYLIFMTCNSEMCLPPTEIDFNWKAE